MIAIDFIKREMNMSFDLPQTRFLNVPQTQSNPLSNLSDERINQLNQQEQQQLREQPDFFYQFAKDITLFEDEAIWHRCVKYWHHF